MNCGDARQHLHLLDDPSSASAGTPALLAHLRGCPACARAAESRAAMRRAVGHAVHSTPVSPGSRERTLARLRGEKLAALRSRRLRAASYAAAAVVAVSAVAWQTFDWFGGSSDVARVAPALADALNSALAKSVVEQHRLCISHGGPDGRRHQNPQLPDSYAGLRGQVTSALGDSLHAAVPNFDAAGYQFASCNYCGLSPSEHGLHLLLHGSNGRPLLSFFVADGRPLADTRFKSRADSSRYFAASVNRDDTDYAVVGWQDPEHGRVFLACTVLPVESLLASVQIARSSDPTGIASAVASDAGTNRTTDPIELSPTQLYRRQPRQQIP